MLFGEGCLEGFGGHQILGDKRHRDDDRQFQVRVSTHPVGRELFSITFSTFSTFSTPSILSNNQLRRRQHLPDPS